MHARLENLANIRVPVIAAIEGRASVHALLANVIVAGEGAAFNDLPLFAGGIVPATESSPRRVIALAHEGRRRFFSNPQPVSARTQEWGVVAEVVPDGNALSWARELAWLYLKAGEVTRRNSRAHFIQASKERIVREVGSGSRRPKWLRFSPALTRRGVHRGLSRARRQDRFPV